MTIPSSIRLWLLLIPLIPSLIVTIFNLYHLLRNRALRTALTNHVIIILLSYGFFEELTGIPWQIHFYRTGSVLSTTSTFCVAYVFIDPCLITSIKMLMGWASVERHILVFHQNWLGTKKKRVLFHYFPLSICMIWPPVFYFLIFVIQPCDIPFSYNTNQCGRYACLTANPTIRLVDSTVNFAMPPFMIVIFSVALLVRVLYQKHRIRQRIEWRNYRKMIVQLLLLSSLYLVFQFPSVIMYVAYSAGFSKSIAYDYYVDMLFFAYYTTLFTPFVTVVSLPDMRTKCRNVILFWQRKHPIQPEMIPMACRNVCNIPTLPPAVTTGVAQ